MIGMATISADTGRCKVWPNSAYRVSTASNAALTFRVPPRPARSTTATITGGPTLGRQKNICDCFKIAPTKSETNVLRSKHTQASLGAVTHTPGCHTVDVGV